MARARLLDVPRHERRPARAGRALRLDLEPQFRGPTGQRRPHPPRQPGHGRGGGGDRPSRGCAEAFLSAISIFRSTDGLNLRRALGAVVDCALIAVVFYILWSQVAGVLLPFLGPASVRLGPAFLSGLSLFLAALPFLILVL